MYHTPKQSQYVRCAALELILNRDLDKKRTPFTTSGSPNFFVRGSHQLLHNSSRAAHLT